MYHRVISEVGPENGVQAGMYVEPNTFKRHLLFLKRYFSVRPISEIISRTKENIKFIDGKPFCALTFDDGWHDFYTNCFPILKAYDLPATVFLATDLIGTSGLFWTDRLSHALASLDRSMRAGELKPASSSSVAIRLMSLKGSLEDRLEKAIEIMKALRREEIEAVLSDLEKRSVLNREPKHRSFLSWEEVREMRATALISFGSHTAAHSILTTLMDGEIQRELVKSREILISEKIVDPTFIPFSYPNGNYNEKIINIVRNAGYHLAVTTDKGWNDLETNLFTLKRIPVHQDMTRTEAMFGCRIANIL